MRPERRPLTRLQSVLLAGATFLLLATAITALGPLIAGSGWWWLCAFVAAGTIFTGAGLRAIRAPASLVPVLELVALVVLLTLTFGGSTSFALILPTVETFELFGSLIDGAQTTIEQQSVPAIPVPALLFALALGAGVIAVVMDLLVQTLRVPAFAAAPAFAPILIPGFIIEQGADVPTLLLTAAAYLLLLRVDVRIRRSAELAMPDTGVDAPAMTRPGRVPIASTIGATLGLAGIGLLTASVLAAATPSVSTSLLIGTAPGGTLFARGVSPYVDLGRDLRRPQAVPAFHYTSPDSDRPYFTLLTIDRFEGEVWGASERAVDGDNTLDRLPQPVGLSTAIETSEHTIDVVIDQVTTTWLPAPYASSSIEGLSGSWFWDSGSLNVRSVDATTAGQDYRITRLEAEPTVDQLRGAPDEVPRVVEPLLELPDDMPETILAAADAVTEGAGSRYDAAVAIQRYLRSSEFRYSEEAPLTDGYDGGGFDVIEAFLEEREGYCVHFASTMAVLARAVDIPARISVGYTAGTPTGRLENGEARVEVDSHDLHAWPELFFAGVGWVQFEPTPGRGSVPAYSRPGANDGDPLATPRIPSSETLTDGPTGLDTDTPDAGAAADPLGAAGGWLRGGGLVALALGLLAIPALLRVGQRMSRLRRIRRGPEPADAAWDEVLATAADLGDPVPRGLTPRTTAARLASRPAFTAGPAVGDTLQIGDAAKADDTASSAMRALLTLRDAVERERYGPESELSSPSSQRSSQTDRADELVQALDDVREALGTDAGAAARLRGALVPRSLVTRHPLGEGTATPA